MDKGIRLLRAKRGAMAAAAREVGVSRQAVAKWERVPLYLIPKVNRLMGKAR